MQFFSLGHEKISTGHDGISTGLDTTAKKMKLGKYTGGGQQKEIAPPNQVCICYSKQVCFNRNENNNKYRDQIYS